MSKGVTFLRLMRCFRCMIIETEESVSEPPVQSTETAPEPPKQQVYMEPPGVVEPLALNSTDSDDDWVITD